MLDPPAPPSGERHADAYRVTRAASPHRKFFSDTLPSMGKLTLTARLPSLLLFHRHRHRDWLQGIVEFVSGGDDLVHYLHAVIDLAEDGVAPIQATAVVSKLSCTACQGIESCIQYSIDFIVGGVHVCSIEHYDG